ncbi:phage portal protein [Oceanibaculum nanhaiense]|uniref:phage portal protein n=1 Tax=Oceanibaculum nanhaiense TaxID=1909734 RepID=UPI003D2AABD5
MKTARVNVRVKGTRFYLPQMEQGLEQSGPRVTASSSSDQTPYETVGRGRRSVLWRAANYGPNAALDYALEPLRNQSREMVRKNGLAAAAMDRWTANLVGTGIKPQIADDAMQARWLQWTDEADADGVLDFYGQQAMGSDALFAAGEFFVRFRPRRLEDGLSVPLQLQLLEAEFCPTTETRLAPNGNEIRNGIEFDRRGQRVAYWMYTQHPNDASALRGFNGIPVRVPASEILHIFIPGRPGQHRGEPRLTRALAKLKDLDAYDDAELVRKKTAAMFAGFIRRPVPALMDEAQLKEEWGDDAEIEEGIGMATLEPGSMQQLGLGEEITFSEPADVGGSYEAFMRQQHLSIATSVGLLYEQLTGDYSKLNDRTWRAAFNEFKRRAEMLQHNIMVFQFCRPVMKRWHAMAMMAGAEGVPADMPAARWIPQGWPYINPKQDVEAKVLEVRAGFTSRQAVVSERGDDVQQIDQEQREDMDRADSMGLTYTTDPRTPEPPASAAPAEGEDSGVESNRERNAA